MSHPRVTHAATALAVALTWSGALAMAPSASAAPAPPGSVIRADGQHQSLESGHGGRGKDRRRDPDPHTPIPAAAQDKAAQKDASSVVAAATGVVIGGGSELPAAVGATAAGKQSAALTTAVSGGGAVAAAQPAALAAAGVPSQVSLGYAQQPQQASYFCGPAAVVQALALLGINRSQSEVADRLQTDEAGYQTSWSGTPTWYYAPDVGATNRPVADVMGSYMYGWGRSGRYYSADVPEEPSAADVNTFQQRLVADASTGYPLIGDAWEVQGAGNLRLPGHPAVFPNTAYDVFHWYTIHGYENYGATTYVTDPAAGSPYVSWSSTIPRYSKVDSETLTVINGGRGYVW